MIKFIKLICFVGLILLFNAGVINALEPGGGDIGGEDLGAAGQQQVVITTIAQPNPYGGRGMKVITATSSWTAEGVTRVKVELLGGGGSGSANVSQLGGGGGAGGYISATFSVHSGESLSFVIGAEQAVGSTTGNYSRLTYGSMVLTASGGGGGSTADTAQQSYGPYGAGGIGGSTNIDSPTADAVILTSKGADGQTTNSDCLLDPGSPGSTYYRGGGNGASSIYGGGGHGKVGKINPNTVEAGSGSYGAGGGGGNWELTGSTIGKGGQGIAIIYC